MNELGMTKNSEWLRRKAAAEAGRSISVGGLACELADRRAESPASRLAFRRLIALRRRELGMSFEEVARRSGASLLEVFRAERDDEFDVEPRLVSQLAGALRLPEARMMQLAGLAEAKDPVLGEVAVRFAARSEPVERLSPEEHEALDEFVKFLAEK
jgi:hypothetical protein